MQLQKKKDRIKKIFIFHSKTTQKPPLKNHFFHFIFCFISMGKLIIFSICCSDILSFCFLYCAMTFLYLFSCVLIPLTFSAVLVFSVFAFCLFNFFFKFSVIFIGFVAIDAEMSLRLFSLRNFLRDDFLSDFPL